MTAPNTATTTITASLERSLQRFSLNHHSTTTSAAAEESPTTHSHRSANSSDATLELNSNITLPYHWEQCLDLKTGEMYYINWRTGMKTKEDPRMVDDGFWGYLYSDDDDDDEEAGEESSYEGSEESSVESSADVSSSRKQKQKQIEDKEEDENESCISGNNDNDNNNNRSNNSNVLVVAGCKGCFMYFMVPKQVEDCPKCCAQLLHFDRSSD